MLANTADIRTELEQLTDLPVPVRSWLVEDGLDATDDPAVWVWALLDADDFDPDRMARIRFIVRDVVRSASGLWAYVLFRGVDEAAEVASWLVVR